MADKNKIRMLRVSEKVWDKLMRMKLDMKKDSVDDLLSDVLKLNETAVPKEKKPEQEVKKEDKSLAAG